MSRSAFQALRRLRPAWLRGAARGDAGPQRPIGLGLAGLGPACAAMLPTFLQDRRVRLAAAWDPDEAARGRFSRSLRMPACAAFGELLRDPAVEAVYLSATDPGLPERVGSAARHGKHVMVERPATLTLEECDAMTAACRDAGVILLLADAHSFDPPYLQARTIIDAGEVGAVRMIHALNYTDGARAAPGSGDPAGEAAHQVDVVRLLAGSRVTRVRAVSGAGDAQGACSALLWFENGSFASMVYSGRARFNSHRWCGGTDETGLPEEDCCAAGGPGAASFVAPVHDGFFARPRQHPHVGPVIVSCERADLQPMPDAVWVYGERSRERRALDPLRAPRCGLVDELLAAIRHGQGPRHDGAWARATLQVCRALRESVRTQADVLL